MTGYFYSWSSKEQNWNKREEVSRVLALAPWLFVKVRNVQQTNKLFLRQGTPYYKKSQAEAEHWLNKYAVRGTLYAFIPGPGTELADL